MVSTMVSRLLPSTSQTRDITDRMDHSICVLLSMDCRKDWTLCIWNLLNNASHPRHIRFCVLLDCSTMADMEIELDSFLAPMTFVDFVLHKRGEGARKRTQRLVRKFVVGNETLVVVPNEDSVLLPCWDSILLAHCLSMKEDVLVSCPSRSTYGRGHFPCADEEGKRVDSLPFQDQAERCVSSVMWCPELTVGTPTSLINWCKGNTTRHMILSAPLLVDDRGLETRSTPHSPPVPSSKSSRVGMVDKNDVAECIAKFGSQRCAGLAIRFGYEFAKGGKDPQ